MASNENTTPDQEATKWFRLAMIGTVLYVGAVFSFIISAKVGNEAAMDHQSDAHQQGQEQHD